MEETVKKQFGVCETHVNQPLYSITDFYSNIGGSKNEPVSGGTKVAYHQYFIICFENADTYQSIIA